MNQLSKFLIFAGILLVVIGLVLAWSDRIPWLGKLPGDILIKKKNFTFYFPIVTTLILSLLLSLILLLINRWK